MKCQRTSYLKINPFLFATILKETRQVYNLFQEPVEKTPMGFSIAEEKIRQF